VRQPRSLRLWSSMPRPQRRHTLHYTRSLAFLCSVRLFNRPSVCVCVWADFSVCAAAVVAELRSRAALVATVRSLAAQSEPSVAEAAAMLLRALSL
jgi:hypothetical protein